MRYQVIHSFIHSYDNLGVTLNQDKIVKTFAEVTLHL